MAGVVEVAFVDVIAAVVVVDDDDVDVAFPSDLPSKQEAQEPQRKQFKQFFQPKIFSEIL